MATPGTPPGKQDAVSQTLIAATDAEAPRLYRRAGRSIVWTVVIAIGLLATHRGEFWPFSIYPMFSRAGRPFVRAVVRELPVDVLLHAGPYTLGGLPGEPFPLAPANISQNDVATFLKESDGWTPERAQALQHVFAEYAAERRLVIFTVRGEPQDGDVKLTFFPSIELTPDGPHPLQPTVRR